jgi:hypothetical protein
VRFRPLAHATSVVLRAALMGAGGLADTGAMPMRIRLGASFRSVAALAGALCVLAGPAAASVSPDRLVSSALAAARAQRSVHYVTAAVSSTVSVRMVGDAALDRGIQRITYRNGGKSGHVTVLVVANTAYVRGDAFALASYMGFSGAEARRLAGHWLKIPHTARSYPTVSAAVRLRSTISELALPRPRVALPQSVLNGQRVIGIRNTSVSSGHSLTRTLYVRASGLRLPVAELTRGGGSRGSVTFSNWNHRVSVSAPPGATLIG